MIALLTSSGRLEKIVFLNLTLTLIFTYILFVIGAHVTSITALCAVMSALLQLLMMVFFCSSVLLTLCLYLNLGEVPKHLKRILLCSSLCASWCKLYIPIHIIMYILTTFVMSCCIYSTTISYCKCDSGCLAQLLLHRLLVS